MKRWYKPICSALIFAAVNFAAAQLASSFFDSTAEGWTNYNDATPGWSVFGNPGGSFQLVDHGTGQYFYFAAPASFLGNKSSLYGGRLRYQLWTDHVTTSGESQPDVMLVGGGLTIVLNTANPAVNTWSTYDVPVTIGDWKLTNYSGSTATEAQMRTVLGSLTACRIRAEFSTSHDTSYLDNVAMWAQTFEVHGVIELQDLLPDASGREVIFEIIKDGLAVETRNVTLDIGGGYTFGSVITSTCFVRVKGSHWLRKIGGPFEFVESSGTDFSTSLINGDIDNDNEVTLVDYSLFGNSFGLAEGDPNWNAEADLDGDKEVTLADYSILARNFGQVGDE